MTNYFIIIKTSILLIIPIILPGVSEENHKITGNHKVFILNPGANPNNPLAYSEYAGSYPPVDCPQRGEICVIAIHNEDVYTGSEAIEEGDPSLEGRPKVTIGTQVSYEIADALDPSEIDPYIAPSGRVYFQTIESDQQ